MFDIHSHVLPSVDDGAENISDSINILTSMYQQGITDVVTTPHFYPHNDNLEDYFERTKTAFEELMKFKKDKEIPNIYLGCEVLYYSGISKADSITQLTINNSNYLLLELTPFLIGPQLFSELLFLKNKRNIIPIIAHIERYYKSRNYKKFLEFIKKNNILTQVNAAFFFSKNYPSKLFNMLFLNDSVSFIATDAHSMESRPPLLKQAFEKIETVYGIETKQKLIENADKLLKEITKKDIADDIK